MPPSTPSKTQKPAKKQPTTVAPKDDLRTVAIFLDLPVATAVQAAVVTTAADLIFARDPEHKVFTMNTANTLAYRALKALEDRCVVEIAETLKDEHNMIPATAAIRRKPELRNHRDAVSHTTTISWRRADMQVFFDSKKQWTDLRAALIWDMWRSVNDDLVKAGQPVRDLAVPIGQQHATMLYGILRYSMTPAALAEITEEALLAFLEKTRDSLLDYATKRPDGDRTRD